MVAGDVEFVFACFFAFLKAFIFDNYKNGWSSNSKTNRGGSEMRDRLNKLKSKLEVLNYGEENAWYLST